MPAEAAVSVTVKSAKGDLHTLRGDNWDDFVANATAALGSDAATFLAGVRQTFGSTAPFPSVQDERQAMASINQAFPGTQPVSTVGQPLPQPGAAAPAAPPTLAYPGDCAHGRREYRDSVARGKQWRRWECAVPWSKDSAAGRCKPLNVEA